MLGPRTSAVTTSNEDPTDPTLDPDDASLAVESFVSFAASLRGELRAAYEALAARDRAFGEDVGAELVERGKGTRA